MNVENEIKTIHRRNIRVEADKAWEISLTRRTLISFGTYAVAILWLYVIGNEDFLFNAAIPAGGYILSTLTLPLIKRAWMRRKNNHA